jgi:hypothetical protein
MPFAPLLLVEAQSSPSGGKFEVSLLGRDVLRGVAQSLADGDDGGRPSCRSAGGAEYRSLEALLAEAARGDLRHRRRQQRRQQGDGSA